MDKVISVQMRDLLLSYHFHMYQQIHLDHDAQWTGMNMPIL